MLNNFSLWLSLQEIHGLFEQTLHALNAKKLSESMNLESDPIAQLKPMNAAFSKMFGMEADWVDVAVFALNGVNRFDTHSSDFSDSLTETLGDVYMWFQQEGHQLHAGLQNIKSQEVAPEEKRNQMLKLFRQSVVNRFRNRSAATVRLKRQVDLGRGRRTDKRAKPSFTPYEDLIKSRGYSKPTGEDDAPPDATPISGRFGQRGLMDTDDEAPEEVRGMGDDGTALIQATKKELLDMKGQAGRREVAERIQLAHDNLEEIIKMKQSGASFSEFLNKFATHGKKMSAIFNDIKMALVNAGQNLGLTIGDRLASQMDREHA